VLDAGLELFQWNGKQSAVKERTKAGELVRSLRDERKGAPKIATFDEGQEDNRFWDLLGGKGPVSSAAEGGDDEAAEKNQNQSNVAARALFQLSDASGKLTFTQKAKGKVTKQLFLSQDAFIFDAGGEIFVGSARAPARARGAALSPTPTPISSATTAPLTCPSAPSTMAARPRALSTPSTSERGREEERKNWIWTQ